MLFCNVLYFLMSFDAKFGLLTDKIFIVLFGEVFPRVLKI